MNLVNEREEAKAAATILRCKAQAIYAKQDYTIGEALEALNYVYGATKLELAHNLPPQTDRVRPVENKPRLRTITEDERKRCQAAHDEYVSKIEEKKKAKTAAKEKPAPPDYKQMPEQITFSF